MSEKLVNSAWRTVILTLIALGALGASLLLYLGVLHGLNLRWDRSICFALSGLGISLGVWLLCRYRNDLVCT